MASDTESLVKATPIPELVIRKSPRPVRLRSSRDARKLLGKAINWCLAGRLHPDDLSKLSYALSVFAKLTESADLEESLREIEEKLGVTE